MLDYLNLGHRLEIAPGSVVMVNVNTDEMREFPTLAAAYRAQIEGTGAGSGKNEVRGNTHA